MKNYTWLIVNIFKKGSKNCNHIFIDTSATPIIPDITGIIKSKNIVINKEIMELTKLPKHFVILEADAVGLGFYQQLVSRFTLISNSDRLLEQEDDGISLADISKLTRLISHC
ncbi:hypothetical protein [Lactovum miscens]|uniref:Pyruvate/2-oxoglutarate dehydrogenase complex dihydrolipoamide dehydrogenase (E3) component n=1 Tax=Lactovum miscens TaxID=190387 RepID=A0A841C590_9LACT|nr:hypothetical protein [Lactovum miscens]MBB5887514.1 pyruvate/2-oxoglutarate dehydrogenase complex dihydrolipoamide dehydrogenase (E3) component [Lactovum miscens]